MSTALEDRWHRHEEARLRCMWGWRPVREIAEALGRSETAVTVRAKRIGLRSISNHPDILTEYRIAPMLGIDRKITWMWMNKGILPVEVMYKCNLPVRVVWRGALERWVKRPENWIYVSPDTIVDDDLRLLAQTAYRRWGDEWITPGQAAALLGVHRRYVNKWTHQGVFRQAVKWGNWRYRRSEVEAVRDLVGQSWR